MVGSLVSVSQRLISGSSWARAWSNSAGSRLVPSLIVPESGASLPVSIRSSVVLPTPFGPTKATRSPRRIRSEKSRTISFGP